MHRANAERTCDKAQDCTPDAVKSKALGLGLLGFKSLCKLLCSLLQDTISVPVPVAANCERLALPPRCSALVRDESSYGRTLARSSVHNAAQETSCRSSIQQFR